MYSIGSHLDILNFDFILFIICLMYLFSPAMTMSSTYKPIMHFVILFFVNLKIHCFDLI